jgi:hypothetical protein
MIRRSLNNRFEKFGKAVVAHFKILCWHYPGGADEKTDTLNKGFLGVRGWLSKSAPPELNSEARPSKPNLYGAR